MTTPPIVVVLGLVEDGEGRPLTGWGLIGAGLILVVVCGSMLHRPQLWIDLYDMVLPGTKMRVDRSTFSRKAMYWVSWRIVPGIMTIAGVAMVVGGIVELAAG